MNRSRLVASRKLILVVRASNRSHKPRGECCLSFVSSMVDTHAFPQIVSAINALAQTDEMKLEGIRGLLQALPEYLQAGATTSSVNRASSKKDASFTMPVRVCMCCVALYGRLINALTRCSSPPLGVSSSWYCFPSVLLVVFPVIGGCIYFKNIPLAINA